MSPKKLYLLLGMGTIQDTKRLETLKKDLCLINEMLLYEIILTHVDLYTDQRAAGE